MNTRKFFYAISAFLLTVGMAAAEIPDDARHTQPLKVGSSIPDVTVVMPDGTPLSLREQIARQPTVLVFYRGGWCPYCNTHLAELGQVESTLRELGYQILALSPDRPERVAEAAAEAEFAYQLLSDHTMEAAIGFGVAFRVDAETSAQLKGYGIDLDAASGESHHLLPVPSVFLINTSHRIIYRHANPDYRERLSAEVLLRHAEHAVAPEPAEDS